MQKFKLHSSAVLAAILLLCAAHSSAQKTDTIKVFIMVADTSVKMNIYQSYLIAGYEVRRIDTMMVVEVDDPNKTTYIGGGLYSTTLMAKHYREVMKPKYTHLGYLGYDLLPLPKRFSIFSVHSRG
jgi:hypothetical protein